jgi:hypothetical protein
MKAIVFALTSIVIAILFAPAGMAATKAQSGTDPRSVTLACDPNSETDLAGYNIYQGSKASGPYLKIGNVDVMAQPSYSATGPANGTHYSVMTALNTPGRESGHSNEVSKTVAVPPAPPNNLRTVLQQFGEGARGWQASFDWFSADRQPWTGRAGTRTRCQNKPRGVDGRDR